MSLNGLRFSVRVYQFARNVAVNASGGRNVEGRGGTSVVEGYNCCSEATRTH